MKNSFFFTKRLLYIFFLVFIIVLSNVIWRQAKKGFRPHKIIGSIPFDYKNIETSPEDEKKTLKILDQKFKYLNKGSQAFVFTSEDNRYVIKFIALNKYREPFRKKLLGIFHIGKNYRENRILNRNRNLKNALCSYKIAYELLKNETGIIYLHINKNEKVFTKKINIMDKMGTSYKIDPNKTLFIIQKRAKKLKPYITKLAKENNNSEIEKIISDYLELSFSELKKGVINKDSAVKNMGYVNNHLIELDLGRFQKKDDIEKSFIKYFDKQTQFCRKFLQINAPESILYFDEKLKQLGKKYG